MKVLDSFCSTVPKERDRYRDRTSIQEAESGRSKFQGHSGQLSETLSQQKIKTAVDVAPFPLTTKHSVASTTKQN